MQLFPPPLVMFNSAALTKEEDKEFSKDEIILQLKIELERLLNSNKTKRNLISRLQSDLDDYQRTVEDLKEQLVKTNVHEVCFNCGVRFEILIYF